MIVFNRPYAANQMFANVKAVKPKSLYIAADGPRDGVAGDAELCLQTRSIINQIDWECDVKTMFRDKNVGCKLGPCSAIDWVFAEKESCIILEDDCVPSVSFFKYCEELLERYRDNERIFMISGNNFLLSEHKIRDSYYFSRYHFIWGWATWRRAWRNFDISMKQWNASSTNWPGVDYLNNMEKKYWHNIYSVAQADKLNEWDYKWAFAMHLNTGLSICPAENLVTNIGDGNNATHTKNNFALQVNLPHNEIRFPLTHPDELKVDWKAEAIAFEIFFGPFTFWWKVKSLGRKLDRLISKKKSDISFDKFYLNANLINRTKYFLFKTFHRIFTKRS